MKFNTKTIHGGQEPDPAYGAVMPPVYLTSTYAQKTPGDHKGYEYSRTHNPTRDALQRSLASLENAKYGLAFASGLAATDAVLKLLKPGDEVLSVNDLYGGTYRIFTKIFEGYGLKFRFEALEKAMDIEKLISKNTRLIWIETPTNPMMNIIDIKTATKVAAKHSIMVAVDNTFATPYLQTPLDLGADIVVHSITKYLSGHSDVVMGGLAFDRDDLHEKLSFIQNASGAVPGAMDSFLVLRGIKTLHVRMQRHCENAKKMANYLLEHPRVKKVYWPGFESHPGHKTAKEQMTDFGGMVSFIPENDSLEGANSILEKLKIFTLAESLGGVESLAGHPATMTHASIPKNEREKSGVTDSLIRLSVGIEDADDLINDLKEALG